MRNGLCKYKMNYSEYKAKIVDQVRRPRYIRGQYQQR